ncbi:hypothetical protein [Streptomyces sp. SID12488]|uniref:hypothetical protein n=1 Tax=Streptomyces sp. SID12488 TaxID=2706040 RepID=UPI0013DC6FDE|nr:hypothetical protein [Streptomyces sp. SID12488]NEA67544.1 hypothetical protein [Streptomyces sp. SID12488]
MSEESQTEDPMVAALLREREGYAVRGMDDRTDQVDEQLRLRGVEPPAAQNTPTAASRSTPPKGRRTRDSEKA